MTDPVRVARSRLANSVRRGDPPDVENRFRRELVLAKLRRAIASALEEPHAPDLADRRELAALLTREDV